jgi:hypothetical protein
MLSLEIHYFVPVFLPSSDISWQKPTSLPSFSWLGEALSGNPAGDLQSLPYHVDNVAGCEVGFLYLLTSVPSLIIVLPKLLLENFPVRYHCGGWSEEVNSCILISYMVYL